MHATAHPQNGFSLTELLIVLAIMGSLFLAGVPTLGHLLVRTRTSNAEAALTGSLLHARSAAVTHNVRTLMCPSIDGRRCQADAAWQHGWVIAEDADHDGQPDANVPLIAVQAALAPGTRIITSAGRRQITFQPTGGAGGSNVRFTICRSQHQGGRSVVVANSGRIRTAAPDSGRLRQCRAGLG